MESRDVELALLGVEMAYYLANGYRLVIPYLHTLKCTVNDSGLKVTDVSKLTKDLSLFCNIDLQKL